MSKKDRSIPRRDALTMGAVYIAALPALGCTRDAQSPTGEGNQLTGATTANNTSNTTNGKAMRIHYLEIVTKDVDATCKVYSGIHGLKFGDADQSLGGARTAKMADGGMMGIRAPMHDGEKSVTRAYMLVDDIEAAVAAAKNSGADIAVPPMEIPGHGTCAIYVQSGIEAGLWQL